MVHFFGPTSWGPGNGPMYQIILNISYQVNFQYFKPNFVCLLKNERYNKTYQMGFLFSHLGLVPWVGLGSNRGWRGQKFNLSEIQPNFVCELLIWMARATAQLFWFPASEGLGERPKGQKSLHFNNKVNFKYLKTKLCVFSHKWKILNILDGIFNQLPV